MKTNQPQDQINNISKLFNEKKFLHAESLTLEFVNQFPKYAIGWKILAVILKQNGNLKKSLKASHKALLLNPKDAEVYYNLANSYKLINNFKKSQNNYKKAIELNPNYAEAYNNLGVTYQELGKLQLSEINFKKAIELNPNYAEGYMNIGNILRKKNKLNESLLYFQKTILLSPNYVKGYNNLGVTLRELGKLEASEISFKKAIKLKNIPGEIYYNLAATLRELGKLKESELNFKKAIKLNPEHAETFNNLGVVLRELGKLKESELSFKKAIKLKPEYAAAYNNLSFNCLLQHKFREGFKLYEWRWKANKKIGKTLVTNKPIWAGTKNLSILAWKEQGIGDEIMFSSLFPELIRDSKSVIVNCDKRLIPIFKRSFSNKIIYESKIDKVKKKDYDQHIPIGSLPLIFRKNLKSFEKSSKAFLKADDRKIFEIKNKLKFKKSDFIIGISWLTKSNLEMASFRNISLNDLTRNLYYKNVKFVNLQYGNVENEISLLKIKEGIDLFNYPEINNTYDIDGLASLISACDLIVTIDNFIAHLAGSLGIHTKVLLPFTADPRWGNYRKKTHLYRSVHLHRQDELGNWKEVLTEIKKEIKKIIIK